MTVQLRTRKRMSRTASEGDKHPGMRVFEARGRVLRAINGKVFFTVIKFLFTHSPYFLITSRIFLLVPVFF